MIEDPEDRLIPGVKYLKTIKLYREKNVQEYLNISSIYKDYTIQ